jgi:hypothetical protein
MMKRCDATKVVVSAALKLAVTSGLLVTAGCSDSSRGSNSTGDKTNDPALKAYMTKTSEAFKAKSQHGKK